MEKYTMFLDWKNQHCENDYTTQSNLQIQCNPYQTTNGIFHTTSIKNFTIWKETQKIPNSPSNLDKEKWSRASLVVQWLRIHLPMQGTRVRALVREDPTCRRATKPVCHNYWACALEPVSHSYWAHVPQLLKPLCLEPVLHNEKPLQWEACAPQRRVAPALRK